jgi:hypothetical protein
MIATVVDPGICAFLALSPSKDLFRQAIVTLKRLNQIIDVPSGIGFYSHDDLVSILGEQQLFPMQGAIDAAIAAHDLQEEFDAGQIRRLVNRIIEACDRISASTPFGAIAAESAVTTPPPDHMGSLPAIREALIETLLWTALGIEHGEADARVALNAGFAKTDTITVYAEACLIDPPWNGSTSLQINSTIPRIDGIEDLTASLDPSLIWREAERGAELTFAITVAAYEVMRGLGTAETLDDVPDFIVGPTFLASLRDHQALGNGKFSATTLDACARLLAGVPKHELSHLRVSENSPNQLMRAHDNAGAWRTHVTVHYEGVRLMFWRHRSGMVEFANIGFKAESVSID